MSDHNTSHDTKATKRQTRYDIPSTPAEDFAIDADRDNPHRGNDAPQTDDPLTNVLPDGLGADGDQSDDP